MPVERISQIPDNYVLKAIIPLASKQGFLPQKPFPPLFIMVTFTLTSSSPRSWEIAAIVSLQDIVGCIRNYVMALQVSHPSQLFDLRKLNGLKVPKKF